MARLRPALAVVAAGVVVAAVVSGGSSADPRTPAALPGMPPPFLGTAVAGSGGLAAAIDAYGDVVDLRAPGPAGKALVDNSAERQAAGSVPADTGIVPRVVVDGGAGQPLWRADSVAQRYLPGTNVVLTVARLGAARVELEYAAGAGALGCATRARGARVSIGTGDLAAAERLHCDDAAARRIIIAAKSADRRWISRSKPLGAGAPAWARRMYRRSLLILRALRDRRTGAVAAGARDGWAYVWPRDAAAATLALAASGYRPEARRSARFLLGLDLGGGARFDGKGVPVAGREAQGDASGWVAVAARAVGLPPPGAALPWRDRPDYQERAPDTYLGNAIAAASIAADGAGTPARASTRRRPGRCGRLRCRLSTQPRAGPCCGSCAAGPASG